MAVTQTITLNQKDYRIQPVLHAVCGDTGRRAKMIVADVVYSSASGELQFARSDGSYYYVPATFDADDNSFTADLTQALTRPGITECELKVTSGGKMVSTYLFRIAVQESPDGLPESQLGITRQDLLDAVNELFYATHGQPTAVDEAAGMTDTSVIYLYLGDEEGYEYGHVYAYIDGAWTDTGLYGQQALPYIMPEMYGAKGDLFTDDTAAIQRAVDAAIALGKPLLFASNAVYYIGGTVNILAPCIIDGNNCIIQLGSKAVRTNVFYVNYSAGADVGVVIRNFRVKSSRDDYFVNGTNPPYTETLSDNNSFIYVHAGDNGLIENIDTESVFSAVFFAHWGFGTDDALQGWRVRGIKATDCLFGIHIGNSQNCTVTDIDLSLAADANLYCHCIYINGWTDNVTIRGGRLTANLEIAQDMPNAPTQPLIDAHQTDVVHTMMNLWFGDLTMTINDPTGSQLYAFNLQSTWFVNVRDCRVNASRLVRSPESGAMKDFYDVYFSGYMIGNATNCRFFGGHFVCASSPALHNLTTCHFYNSKIEGENFVLWDSFTGVIQNCAITYKKRLGRFRSGNTVNLKLLNNDLSVTGSAPENEVLSTDDNTVSGYLTCIGNTYNGASIFADANTIAIVDTSGGGSRAAVFANNTAY